MANMNFPTTAEAMITYHERFAGRPLDDFERSLLSTATETINGAYEDGRGGYTTQFYPCDPDEFWKEAAARYPFSSAGEAFARKFLISWCCLCNAAWLQGRQDAKETVSA